MFRLMNFVRQRPGRTTPGIGAARRPASVAILGADYPGLRPVFTVAEGEQVRRGQVIFTDARHPRIAIVSPVDGTVASLTRSARRVLTSVVLTSEPIDAEDPVAAPLTVAGGSGIRDTLQARGLWPAFLSRPLGRIPAPDAIPCAIFVNAASTGFGALDPRAVVARRAEDFERGLDLLADLTTGPVFVCQTAGPDLAGTARDRLRFATFGGTYLAGLSGHHIHQLHPPGPGDAVWTIGCQDVIAIGHLFNTGHYLGDRIVSLVRADRAEVVVFQTVLGANLREILADPSTTRDTGRHDAAAVRVMSGPSALGTESSYLRRHHSQISIEPVASRTRHLHRVPHPTAPMRAARPAPIVPIAALERALPTDAPPVPLMRALSIGDVETAERLGILDLVEEDVALLTRFCTSGSDYGHLLRRVLDDLEPTA